jgi:hypothetical protein
MSQMATATEFDRTGVESSRVVPGPLVEFDIKVHVVANVMESEMINAEVSQSATDIELDKTQEDRSKLAKGSLGESAEVSVRPVNMIHTEVSKMATNTVDWKEDDGVSMSENSLWLLLKVGR